MGWTKGDVFALWTAIMVTAGALATGLTYLLARRLATIARPSVSTSVRGRGKTAAVSFQIDAPDKGKWLFTKVEVTSPKDARLGSPNYLRDAVGDVLFDGGEGWRRSIVLSPPVFSTSVAVKSPSDPVVWLTFHMALSAKPAVTSRFPTHIKIPA